MKKKALLISLLFTVSTTHGMDLSSCFPWSSGQKQYETPLIKQIKDEKSELENILALDLSTLVQKRYLIPVTLQLFHAIGTYHEFLQYIYYAEFEYNERYQSFGYPMSHFTFIHADKLQQWQMNDINGFSALGVAAIAPNISREQKNDLIQKLFALGFLPTQNDKALAYLDWYEKNEELIQKQVLLCLGANDDTSILSSLPSDIIHAICWCVLLNYDEQPLLNFLL